MGEGWGEGAGEPAKIATVPDSPSAPARLWIWQRPMIAVVSTLLLMLAVAVWPAAAAGDPAAGAKIFAARCARCHGPGGKGDGPDLAKLRPTSSPVNWTRAVVMKKWADDEIVDIITKGGKAVGSSPVMPSFQGKLTDAQIHDLLAFIRTLAK
jgi:mono/diheme cytochrome c family protein